MKALGFFGFFSVIDWIILGFIIYVGFAVVGSADGLEMMNPKWVHDNCNIKWFFSFLISSFLAFIFPMGAICYWFVYFCNLFKVDKKENNNNNKKRVYQITWQFYDNSQAHIVVDLIRAKNILEAWKKIQKKHPSYIIGIIEWKEIL